MITLIFAGIVLALSIVTIKGIVDQEKVDSIVQTTTEDYKNYNVSVFHTIE
jgi:hypothetical protein